MPEAHANFLVSKMRLKSNMSINAYDIDYINVYNIY